MSFLQRKSASSSENKQKLSYYSKKIVSKVTKKNLWDIGMFLFHSFYKL